MRKTLILVLILAVGIVMGALGHQLLNAQPAASPIAVPSKGQTSKINFEQVLSGYLTDVNGKYKLRASEVRVEPEGYVGDHQHRGPGIRLITAGEQTVVANGKSTVYKAGDYYLEAGDVTTAAYNKGKVPLTLLQFELLPADLKGGSSFVPLK
jgi:quercetin dioxygenase-like cupin family protein